MPMKDNSLMMFTWMFTHDSKADSHAMPIRDDVHAQFQGQFTHESMPIRDDSLTMFTHDSKADSRDCHL